MARFGLRMQEEEAIRGLLVAAILLGVLIAGVVPAQAQSSAETRGGRLLGRVAQEDERCGELSPRDLAAIGEFTMDRMAGSARAHEMVNRYMRTRLGPRGELEFHAALGRRIAGCGGHPPVGFGRIMGLTGMMGLRDAPDRGSHDAFGGPGAMMGWRGERSDDDEGPSAGAMIGAMAVLIVAVALALFLLRPRRRQSDPIETLRRRLASGKIGAEEYRERLALLEGEQPPPQRGRV